MSGAVGPGRPPVAGQFRKGKSGNPKGRPRSGPPKRSTSAFDVVIDRTLTVTHNGQSREVTIEEALQHKTYEAALAGNRAARREVLKMIARREQWLAAKAPKEFKKKILREFNDWGKANRALLLLGIADPDTSVGPKGDQRVLLQPWAVQAALRRRGRPKLSDEDVTEIKRCTRDAETLRWPRGIRR